MGGEKGLGGLTGVGSTVAWVSVDNLRAHLGTDTTGQGDWHCLVLVDPLGGGLGGWEGG